MEIFLGIHSILFNYSDMFREKGSLYNSIFSREAKFHGARLLYIGLLDNLYIDSL